MKADFYTVAVRTGGPGMKGISLFLVERSRPGKIINPRVNEPFYSGGGGGGRALRIHCVLRT